MGSNDFSTGEEDPGPPASPTDLTGKRRRVRGLMKGMIVLADDWDSDETNEAIARDFYESEIFPECCRSGECEDR